MPLYVYAGAAMVSGAVIVLVLSLHGARVPAQLVRRNLSNAATWTTDLRTVVPGTAHATASVRASDD